MRSTSLSYKLQDTNPEAPACRILISGDFCPQGKPEQILIDGDIFSPGILEQTAAHHLNILNLECPLTHAETRIKKVGPHLKAKPECAEGIRTGGFQVAVLANNHILDYGEQGLLDTIDACRNAGLEIVGAGRNLQAASQALYSDVNGVRCAILAVAGHEFSIAKPHSAGAMPLDTIKNFYQLQGAHTDADFVLMIIHAGNEYYPLPSPRLAETCRFFARNGANAIVCIHSHVPGGFEIVDGVPIVYGTGNFLLDLDNKVLNPAYYAGYMVGLTLQGSTVTELELYPYYQCKDRIGIDLMNDADARYLVEDIEKYNEILTSPEQLVKAWEGFCAKNRNNYLGLLFSSNRLEAYLWSRGIFSHINRMKRIPRLLNLIGYENHQEVLITIMDNILHGQEND